MKKLFVFILALVMCLGLLVGCGNMALGMGNFTYKKVHVDTHNYSGCLTIEKWHDNSAGIEVETEEAGSIFLSEGTYILLEGDEGCPFCDSGK